MPSIEEYEPLIGAEAVERILNKGRITANKHIVHVNSTYYGGGVAELLSSLITMLNCIGVKTGWRIIQGSPDFFSITKKMHNALQSGDINLSELKMEIYEQVVYENALRNHLDHDVVVIHDPQPLPLINHFRKRGPWIWRCHVDLSNPNKELWSYLSPFIEKYDASVVSLKEYRQKLRTPQVWFMPAIDPFNITNKEMTQAEIDERLEYYEIPTDKPLVVQISRFDKWKDPEGVIQAFKIARKEVDATLVLLGNVATDDPEGEQVYESLLNQREERIILLSKQDTALVNALQRTAAVVLQKSIREGFGLTVSEALYKGTPVIGGNVGGIKYQIKDGVNGYLVDSIEEAADRIVKLIKDDKLRHKMESKAHEVVKQNFLMSRLLENHLDLYNSFETSFKLKQRNKFLS